MCQQALNTFSRALRYCSTSVKAHTITYWSNEDRRDPNPEIGVDIFLASSINPSMQFDDAFDVVCFNRILTYKAPCTEDFKNWVKVLSFIVGSRPEFRVIKQGPIRKKGGLVSRFTSHSHSLTLSLSLSLSLFLSSFLRHAHTHTQRTHLNRRGRA